jgi:hypothetical protein
MQKQLQKMNMFFFFWFIGCQGRFVFAKHGIRG